MINIKTIEQSLLGMVLRYPQALPLVRFLSPDKFVYGEKMGESLHADIWHTILSHDSISLAHQDPMQLAYCQIIKNQAEYYDQEVLLRYADMIEKSGIVYGVSRMASSLFQIGQSETIFLKTVDSIESLEAWLNDIIDKFSVFVSTETSGYRAAGPIVEEVLADWDRMKEGEQLVLLPVGWPSFIEHQLPPLGQLMVLHGMSNMGKSALMIGILLGTSLGIVANGLRGCVAINTLEMSAASIIKRAACLLAGVNYMTLINGTITDDEYERLRGWAEFVGKLPLHIDEENLLTTEVMKSRASVLHAQHGPLLQLGTDYTELFTDDESDNKEENIAKIARNHFAISRKLGSSVIAISQSNIPTTNNYRIAGLMGLRWSRGATHAADIIAELVNYPEMARKGIDYRIPESWESVGVDDSSAWLLIQKYREGSTGVFRLGWTPEYTRFFDPALRDELIIYDHLQEVVRLQQQFKTAVVDVRDTPVGAMFT